MKLNDAPLGKPSPSILKPDSNVFTPHTLNHLTDDSRQTPCTPSHIDTPESLSAQVKPRQYTLRSQTCEP